MTNELMDPIYRDIILDLYRNPHNKKNIDNADYYYSQKNPTCGDHCEIFINVKDNIINEISHSGVGCAISSAGASLLTDYLNNKNIDLAKKLSVAEMLNLFPMEIPFQRQNCALLAYQAFKKALETKI